MRETYLIPEINYLDESVALRKEYDTYWEYNDFFLPQVLDDVKLQAKLIDRYAKAVGDFARDTLHGAFLDVTPHSNDRLIRDAALVRATQSMDIAAEMGVRGVIFHTNRIHGFRDPVYLKNWLAASGQFYTELSEQYPNTDIYLENMFDENWDMLAKLAESMVDVPRFGVCLDYAHASVFGERPEEWIRELKPYIRHIHINDNDGRGDDHLAVGEGVLDWQTFRNTIEECRPDASLLVEVRGIENQRKSLEYMKQHRIYPFV